MSWLRVKIRFAFSKYLLCFAFYELKGFKKNVAFEQQLNYRKVGS